MEGPETDGDVSGIGLAIPSDHILSIAIVGAGIGGLAVALGLRRNGHQVLVSNRPPATLSVANKPNRSMNGLGLPMRLELLFNWLQIPTASSGDGASSPRTSAEAPWIAS